MCGAAIGRAGRTQEVAVVHGLALPCIHAPMTKVLPDGGASQRRDEDGVAPLVWRDRVGLNDGALKQARARGIPGDDALHHEWVDMYLWGSGGGGRSRLSKSPRETSRSHRGRIEIASRSCRDRVPTARVGTAAATQAAVRRRQRSWRWQRSVRGTGGSNSYSR